MRAPGFWEHDGLLPRLLSPAADIVSRVTARRVAQPGWRAPVPVLCVGNAGLGGAGKTTVVLDLVRRLRGREIRVHCLTRGYRGRVRGVLRVDKERHGADLVGDEPLLLADLAPTWVAADRAAGARAAVAAGAQALLMDDGLQNPTLVKTASLLVVDGAVGFGNGRVVPAGPLREPVAAAAARCRACLLIGEDQTGVEAMVPQLPIIRGRLLPDRRLDGQRVFAFSGIARPGKFRQSLEEAGALVVGSASFPDHHLFSAGDLERVLGRAQKLGARPITTAKDSVRLPVSVQLLVDVLGIRLAWGDQPALEELLTGVFG